MPVLNVIGSFEDPNRLSYMSSALLNIRALVNASPEGKRAAVRLIGSPGLVRLCQPSPAPILAMGKALATTWSIHADGNVYNNVHTNAPNFIGNLGAATPSKIIRVSEDITGLVWSSDAGHGGLATATGIQDFTEIGWTEPPDGTGTPAGKLTPTTCAELDNMAIWGGFGPFTPSLKLEMYRSEPLAPGESDAEWFASKEARPDALVDLVVIDRYLWALGADSIEPFYDEGTTTTFPFTEYPNAMNEVGIGVARGTLANSTDTGWFVGTNYQVWQLSGQLATPISPDWVNILLQQQGSAGLATLRSLAYSIGSDVFYVLTQPGQWSIELSQKTGLWNFRASPGRPDFAGSAAVSFGEGGVCLIGLDTGEVCRVEINSASEPAGLVPRMIISPPVGAQEVKHSVGQVDMTSSMGPNAGTFLLDWSEDNQMTWRGQRQIQFPTPGILRAVARGLGTSRMRNFRWRYQGNAAPFVIDALFVLYEEGI